MKITGTRAVLVWNLLGVAYANSRAVFGAAHEFNACSFKGRLDALQVSCSASRNAISSLHTENGPLTYRSFVGQVLYAPA